MRGEHQYWETDCARSIVGEHDVENVVLRRSSRRSRRPCRTFAMHQKTGWALRTVDVAKLVKQGNKLFYRDALASWCRSSGFITGRSWMRLERKKTWCCRLIIGTSWTWSGLGIRTGTSGSANFRFRFWIIPRVPAAVFLDRLVYDGEGRDKLCRRSATDWVLKPLYSFAGKGVSSLIQRTPTLACHSAGRANARSTCCRNACSLCRPSTRRRGMTQAEVAHSLRAWPDGKAMTPMTSAGADGPRPDDGGRS